MTVRKREKSWLTYASQKKCVLQYLICMQTYVKYRNYRILLTGSTIPWSNWFYNIVRVMSFNKGYEFFLISRLPIYSLIDVELSVN